MIYRYISCRSAWAMINCNVVLVIVPFSKSNRKPRSFQAIITATAVITICFCCVLIEFRRQRKHFVVSTKSLLSQRNIKKMRNYSSFKIIDLLLHRKKVDYCCMMFPLFKHKWGMLLLLLLLMFIHQPI